MMTRFAALLAATCLLALVAACRTTPAGGPATSTVKPSPVGAGLSPAPTTTPAAPPTDGTPAPDDGQATQPVDDTSVEGGPTPTSESSPWPYTTPLPPSVPTLLDGTYTKVNPSTATPVPCRRCPDWLPEGGLWRLRFDRGVFRIAHATTGWRTVGSFTISGDQLLLFNDPTCHLEVGEYTWSLEEGLLRLEVIDDACAIALRAKNLTEQPWSACQPPNQEAAVSDHWPKPPGC